jgi:uncharacterized protein YegJ (DUF2314 family)
MGSGAKERFDMTRWTVTAFLCMTLQTVLPAHIASAIESPTIEVSAADAEINAAISKARDTLGEFWDRQANPGPKEKGFALQVAISDGDKAEAFWLVDVKRDAQALSGVVKSEPTVIGNVQAGDRVEFTEDQISDWVFVRDGKMVGNQTMRPLIKRMPPAHAARFRSMYETP